MNNKHVLFAALIAAATLTGCKSRTEAAAGANPAAMSSAVKAAGALTVGKSTPADLRMFCPGAVRSAGSDGQEVWRVVESRPGPVRHKSIVGPIYSKSEPTVIKTTHNFRFEKGVFVDYWADESTEG